MNRPDDGARDGNLTLTVGARNSLHVITPEAYMPVAHEVSTLPNSPCYRQR